MEFSLKFLILSSALLVNGLDEGIVKEKKCFEPAHADVDLDFSWVLSKSRWYFPMMSKLDLYRLAWDALKTDIKDIEDKDLESSCLHADWEGFSPTIKGFGGKVLDYDISPGFDNTFSFKSDWRNGKGGKMYLVQTDNKSYLLLIKCWDHDDQSSWTVMSTVPQLGEKVKAKIYKKLEKLGLKRDLAVEHSFDSCGLTEKKDEL